jgi:hypothetical protein
MNNISVEIVIPHHSNIFKQSELQNLTNILKEYSNKYKISFIYPSSISFQENINLLFKKHNVNLLRVSDIVLSTYNNYNKFLTSSKFYKYFLESDYILLMQLDVIILNGNLDSFLNKKFDYIGAPIFKHDENRIPSFITKGGNGGVTLRNVKKHYQITQKIFFFNLHFYYKEIGYNCNLLNSPFKFIFKKYISRIIPILFYKKVRYKYIQEDAFWSIIVSYKFIDFIVGDLNSSALFAFDMYPSKCYELTSTFPNFLHAIEKNTDDIYNKLDLKNY